MFGALPVLFVTYATLHSVEVTSPVQADVERPTLWVGHIALATHDITRSFAFYRDLGLRAVHEPRGTDPVAELEMRGGTHLVLLLDPDARTDGRGAPFDLMADELDALHDSMQERGIDVSPIMREGHASFTFRDPDGWVITVNDSHVTGVV
jgi:catechol 2,3-dioxygenase-like lactoylglutathione lyase family enzyme